jgi:hypothetical protein
MSQLHRHDAPAMTGSFRRPLRLAALAAGLLAVSGCAQSSGERASGERASGERGPVRAVNRVVYLATTGEAPGDRTPYVDINGRHRLGRAAPALDVPRFRPAVTPADKAQNPQLKALQDLYAALRQRLSDRDDEVQFRQRSMVLHVEQFTQALSVLRLAPGDPLPPFDKKFRDRMAAIKSAIAALRADLIRLNGVLLRLDINLRAGTVVQQRIQQAPNSALQAALAKAIAASLKSGFGLRARSHKLLADFVEWITGQEQALEHLETQVAKRGSAPSGPRTLREIIHRETLLNR